MSRNRRLAVPTLRPRHVVATAIFCLLLPALASAQPCQVPNDYSGTVSLPPAGCGYVSPMDLHMIINGLPPGTTIQVGVEHERFFNVTKMPGGGLGGERESFQSFLKINMNGTGSLSGYSRTGMMIQAGCQTDVGPRNPGDIVQSFDTDMFRLQGQLPPGDPDFDLLRITAGTFYGMPSPGHTTLTLGSDNKWNVDSFFDITYEIEFIGKPGGPLGGMSGSTTGTIRMGTGVPAPPPLPPCVSLDDGTGTAILPAPGCGYLSPQDVHRILDGLPPGTTVEIGAQHNDFFIQQQGPGGSLGGEREVFGSHLFLQLNGTGSLGGYHSTKQVPVQCESHIAPRTRGENIQSFDTDMFMMQGQLPPGDPDFDLLRITGGSGLGMPSPGHTTLTRQPSGGGTGGGAGGGPDTWNVDSFFDITYEIEYIGRPGGPFGGMSGSTTGTIRMQTGQPTTLDVPGIINSAKTVLLVNRPNPFGRAPGTMIEYRLNSPAQVELSVYDAAGKRVRRLTDGVLGAGPRAALWDGRDDSGRRMPAGAYFIKLSLDGKLTATKKAVLVQ